MNFEQKTVAELKIIITESNDINEINNAVQAMLAKFNTDELLGKIVSQRNLTKTLINAELNKAQED